SVLGGGFLVLTEPREHARVCPMKSRELAGRPRRLDALRGLEGEPPVRLRLLVREGVRRTRSGEARVAQHVAPTLGPRAVVGELSVVFREAVGVELGDGV